MSDIFDDETLAAVVERQRQLIDTLRACDETQRRALTATERRAEAAEAEAANWIALVREAARQLEGGTDRSEIQSALYDAVERARSGQAPGQALAAEAAALRTATRAGDVPDAHKIAVYEAMRRYFESVIDDYYTSDTPTDPRYDTGVAEEKTECIGIDIVDGELYVVMAIEGWADLQGFSVELPRLSRDDHTDDGTALTVRGQGE